MKSFALTKKAREDLLNIAIYMEAKWGVNQRNLYIKQLDDAFHLLGRKPTLGKPCDEIKTGYRKFPQGMHVIFYKSGTNTKIEVVRILHKQMDVDDKL